MRFRYALNPLFAIVCTFPSMLRADPFPFSAYATAERVYVRSGPGEDYYATHILSRGDEVEVYWENEDGWLAIRPPQGSYSWVPSQALKLSEQGDVAEVVQDKVPAQIGSQLVSERDATQVRLDVGELVSILEGPSKNNADWCKIAPPAGEFRWLRGADVERRRLKSADTTDKLLMVDPVPTSTESVPTSTEPVPTPTDHVPLPTDPMRDLTDDKSEDVQLTASTEGDSRGETVSWTARRDKKDRAPKPTSNSAWRRPRTASARDAGKNVQEKSSSRETAQQSSDGNLLSGGNLSKSATDAVADPIADAPNPSLVQLQIELSRIVAGPSSTWQLEPLRAKTRYLIDHDASPRVRTQARLLIEKIAEFEDVQLRHEQLSAVPVGTGMAPATGPPIIAGAGRVETPLPPTPFGQNSRYDGSGWLMPVITRRKDVPQYALTDDYGRILKFVTPAPGLNLRRYLRRQIGVTGAERMMPQLYRPHLMAERITVLDQQRR